jgi:hypothetical protein
MQGRQISPRAHSVRLSEPLISQIRGQSESEEISRQRQINRSSDHQPVISSQRFELLVRHSAASIGQPHRVVRARTTAAAMTPRAPAAPASLPTQHRETMLPATLHRNSSQRLTRRHHDRRGPCSQQPLGLTITAAAWCIPSSTETRSKSSVLWITSTKSSVLFLMGTKSSVLLVLCTLAVERRNGGRHPFGDCTLRIDLSDSHKSHLFSSIHYVYR